MIVFGIHCNFFIVQPIRLKTSRSNRFLLFTWQIVHAPEHTREVRARNLSKPAYACQKSMKSY